MSINWANHVRSKIPAARRFVISTGSLLTAFAAQAISVVILAHYLGTEEFGRLVTLTSISTLAAALSGLGANELLRRQVGRDSSTLSVALGHSLIIIFCTGALLLVCFVIIMSLFVPAQANSLYVLGLFGLSNIILTPIVSLTEAMFLAVDDIRQANIINISLALARAITAMIACLAFGVTSLTAWASWYVALHVAVCLFCAITIYRVSTPKWSIIRSELPLGASFGVSSFLLMLRANLDIVILTAIAAPHFIGVYGVARRIIGAGLVVPASFDRLIYGRLAIAGEAGPSATFRLAKRYLIYSVLISALTSVMVFVGAGLVPLVFGAEYTEAVVIVRVLCWTLIFTAIQFLAYDSLNAAELHRIATLISGTSNAAGAALIIWLGSMYGVGGIFISLYLSDVMRGMALWIALGRASRAGR